MNTLTLTLTIDETNLVLDGLGRMPFAKVYAVVGKIQQQAKAQVANGTPSAASTNSAGSPAGNEAEHVHDPAFLGTGWSFPPSFIRGGADVVMVSGVEDVHESLLILLSTRLGERVMREDYGCDLLQVQFEEIDQGLINRIMGLVTDAIIVGEPRIALDQVVVDESAAIDGLLLIELAYTVMGTNSRYNMVYPFYLYEATSVA